MSKKISEERLREFNDQGKILIATMEYDMKYGNHFKHEGFDSKKHLEELLELAREAIAKRRLAQVKNWLRDFTEEREDDIGLHNYIFKRTGLQIDLREKLLKRIEKTIERGRINTNNQLYDVMNEIDFLCQQEKPDEKRISILNSLVLDYEKRIENRAKKNST